MAKARANYTEYPLIISKYANKPGLMKAFYELCGIGNVKPSGPLRIEGNRSLEFVVAKIQGRDLVFESGKRVSINRAKYLLNQNDIELFF